MVQWWEGGIRITRHRNRQTNAKHGGGDGAVVLISISGSGGRRKRVFSVGKLLAGCWPLYNNDMMMVLIGYYGNRCSPVQSGSLSLPISLSGTANGHSGGLRGNYSGP